MTLLIPTPPSTSQTSVERRLDKFLQDVRNGKREPSIVSPQTLDGLSPDDKEVWRTIRKELEDIGITVTDFDANKAFIFERFTNTVKAGAFQEEEMPSPSDLTCTSKIQSRVRSLSSFKIDESNLDTTSGVDVPLVSAKHKKIDFKSLASKQKAAASNITRQISRIAILIAALSRPKKRLSAAVDKKDVFEVRKILSTPASPRALNERSLCKKLYVASSLGRLDLTEVIVYAGVDLNPTQINVGFVSPLMPAVEFQNESMAR